MKTNYINTHLAKLYNDFKIFIILNIFKLYMLLLFAFF